MPHLTFRPLAIADLRQIGRHIQKTWGTRQRDVYLEHLHRRCEQIVSRPHLGRLRNDIRPDYRSIRAGRHVVFYRVTGEGIEVIRILHEAMDPRGRFDSV